MCLLFNSLCYTKVWRMVWYSMKLVHRFKNAHYNKKIHYFRMLSSWYKLLVSIFLCKESMKHFQRKLIIKFLLRYMNNTKQGKKKQGLLTV